MPKAGYGVPKTDALRVRVLHAVHASPAATRAETRRNTAAVLVLAASPMAAFLVVRGSAGLGTRSTYAALTLFVAHGALIFLLYRGLLAFMRSPHGAVRPTRALACAAPLVLIVGALIDAAMASYGFHVTHEALSAHAPCATATLSLGAFAALALVFALRRSQPFAPSVPAALLGCAAGSSAALTVALTCARVDAVHTLIGHCVPVAALGMISAIIGPAALRMRRLDAGPAG